MSKQILERIALRLKNELIKVAPAYNSMLRHSIEVKVTPIGLRVSMMEYGKYVEFGTAPHIIAPKFKKALKFKSGSDTVIVKKVQHPGTRPNPFIRNTLYNKLPQIIREEIARV